MTHPPQADLGALIAALHEAGVEFIVIGGAAAVLHGAPITTQDLDVVHGRSRAWEPGPALSNSFGFGGHNGCLVIGPPPP